MNCPKCKTQTKKVAEETNVETCPQCEGVWVEPVDEKKFLDMKPDVFTLDQLRRLRHHYQSLGKVEEVRYYPCPICNQMMYRKIWGKHSGVIVDRCDEHGTWFDKGEPEKIREYIEAGGIEFEKMRHVDRGLDKLDSRMTQESLRLDKRIDSAYRRARIWSMLGF